jgi:hypothetical protein
MDTTKEIIYDFIDALDLGRLDAKEISLKFKRDGFLEFKTLLKDYDDYLDEEIVDNPRYSDEYIECFVDAAIRENDIEDRHGYYTASAVGLPGFVFYTFLGYIGVSILATNHNKYAPPSDNNHLYVLSARLLGVSLGTVVCVKAVRDLLENKVFYEDVIECSDLMLPLELSGVFSSEIE